MDPWDAARAHAVARVGLGLALIAAPRLVARAWIGRDGARRGVAVYSGALGARDAAIGAGLLAASRGRTGALPWIRAGMAADAADLLITLRHRAALPWTGVVSVGAMAGASAAYGAWLHRRLD